MSEIVRTRGMNVRRKTCEDVYEYPGGRKVPLQIQEKED
jgi:hypothetical protein